jgi:hypothetical protein
MTNVPNLMHKVQNLVMPGVGPGRRGQGIRGFGHVRRATFVSAKVAKTIDAPSGLIGGEGR